MPTYQKKSFDAPDETSTPPNTRMETVNVGDVSVTRTTFQPGWRWSKHIKPIVGTESCQRTHHIYMISGQLHTAMEDGTEFDIRPGEIALTPPGHDAWVVGAEPCVFLDFQNANQNT